jgi:serine/threonine protein phosphatase PrpC
VRDRAAELLDVEACIELLREADHIVQATGGETTCVIIVVHEGGLFGASAGDSEAWIVRDDGTIDDLTAKQHKKRRIGSGRAVPVGFERASVVGTLLMGTDGLYRYARPEAIAEVVTTAATPEDAAEGLVELVRPPSGEHIDDLAVVMVRFAR